MKNKSAAGSLLLVVTALIWGVAFVFQRTGMDSIGPLTFMASRCTLAVPALFAVSACLKKSFKKALEFDQDTIRGGIICGLFMTAANNLQQMGMVYTSAGKAGFVTAMYILLVPFAAWIFFRKKPSGRELFCAALGVAGLFLLCVSESFSVNRGDLLIMGCAVLFSGHILATDRYAAGADAVSMSLIQFAVCTVLGWALAFIFEEPSLSAVSEAGIPIAYCGLLSAGAGYTLQIVGQKYTSPSRASLIMSLEAVFAAVSGCIILKEVISARELAGCVIMFAATLISNIKPEAKS